MLSDIFFLEVAFGIYSGSLLIMGSTSLSFSMLLKAVIPVMETVVLFGVWCWEKLPYGTRLPGGNAKFSSRYLARVTDTEATDTNNPNLNYGIVVDCGSSGSRIFVYCWPRHNGNPHDLLDIKQMRDKNRKPVVMKIKPGTGKKLFCSDFSS